MSWIMVGPEGVEQFELQQVWVWNRQGSYIQGGYIKCPTQNTTALMKYSFDWVKRGETKDETGRKERLVSTIAEGEV